MRLLRVEPLDVFCGRGNKLFGEAGSFGGVVMPPWPSVFAGALRSRILTDSRSDPRDLLLGRLGGSLARVLGNGAPTGAILDDGNREFVVVPGDFRVAWVSLQVKGEVIVPVPSDVVLTGGTRGPYLLRPVTLGDGVRTSAPLEQLLTFQADATSKLQGGYWLRHDGLKKYLQGSTPTQEQLVPLSRLWTIEERVGIGMDPIARTVETGKLFTTEGVRLLDDVAFLVGVEGAEEVLPESGLLRLGGDSRGAVIQKEELADPRAKVDLEEIAQTGRFKLVLLTPGLFPNGWLPFGVSSENYELQWSFDGVKMSAKLVAAAITRFDVVSGWDLARERPKTAQRIVPAWSVYWFEQAKGSIREILEAVLRGGLWEIKQELWNVKALDDSTILWKERRAEGFNNVLVGLWPKR